MPAIAAPPNHAGPPEAPARRPSYFTGQRNANSDMGRLEALVAVATSEDKAAAVVR